MTRKTNRCPAFMEGRGTRCLKIAALHPELDLDKAFLEEAALLHDIGILHTHAPGILCTGDAP